MTFRPGYGHNQRVVAELSLFCTPGRQVRYCIRPTDADAARLSRLPAVAAAAHPMVRVVQGHAADTPLLGYVDGPVHAAQCVEIAGTKVSVPALQYFGAQFSTGFGIHFDKSLCYPFDEAWEPVKAMGMNPIAARLGE